MKKKLPYAVFTALILLICLTPSLGMLTGPTGDGAGGNQALSSAPSLRKTDGSWNTEYLSQIQDYAADNFFLRQEMITAWSILNAKGLQSSITGDVVLGRDGWLYFGDTLPDYAGLEPMSGREIYSAARNLALMQEYCQEQGAKFLFTIAPNKNSLYPEHMPDITASSAPSSADRLEEELAKQGVPYLDLFSLFQEESETLYFKTDSHWNSKGAALAADAVNGALGRSSSYFDGPFSPEEIHRGDLYDMLYPAGEGLETDLAYEPELAVQYDVPIRSAENLTIMTHGGGADSLLMFRDSFGNLLYPYIADSFDAALFSRSMPYRLDLTAQREADYVVAELVERNLRYLIQNVPVMPAPRRELPEGLPETFYIWDVGIRFTVEASDLLPGYVLVTEPKIPEDLIVPEVAQDSPVLVPASDGCFYEAFLLEGGSAGLYLPEDVQPLGLAYAQVWGTPNSTHFR